MASTTTHIKFTAKVRIIAGDSYGVTIPKAIMKGKNLQPGNEYIFRVEEIPGPSSLDRGYGVRP